MGTQALAEDNKMAMVLTYFHAMVQERRNYIPQGWTKSYEFNYGDYKAGLVLLSKLKEKYEINWPMLYGLMLDTIYGGRIDNSVDLRILDTAVHEFFNEDVLSGNKELAKGLKATNLSSYREILPEDDKPSLYGLPPGIDKAILRMKGKEMIESLKILGSLGVESKKFSREVWSKNLHSIFTLWKSLQAMVSKSGLTEISEKEIKSVDPINSFVFNEAN